MMGLIDRVFKRQPVLAKKSYPLPQLIPRYIYTAKWTDFTKRKAIDEAYKRSTWVYACIHLRAQNIASVPWLVETYANKEWKPLENHPLIDLLDNPNPDFDWSTIMRRAVYSLDLSGDFYMSKVRGGSQVREIWPLLPDSMEVVSGAPQRLIGAYKYRYSGESKILPAEDVIHLKYTAPGDLFYGLAPLHAAARAVDIDEEAEKWQKISLQNQAVPPGAFDLGPDVTQEQFEQMKKWVKEQSGAEHAGEHWVIGGGGKYIPMAHNPKEMDFIESRKLTREEICAVYSVPLPLVGVYDHATLANIETSRKILWKEGLIPVLGEIEGQLNRQVAREFGDNIRMRPDLSNVEALREDYGQLVNNARVLWSMGVPFNAVNRELELGFDDIEGGDIGYLPGGLLPTDLEWDDPPPAGDKDMAKLAYGK